MSRASTFCCCWRNYREIWMQFLAFELDLCLILFHQRNCTFKGTVHPKMKILSSFTHPQVDPNLYECVCSEHKGRYSEEWGKQSSIFLLLLKSMVSQNSLITNFLQNIFLCVQNKHIHTGLDLLEGDRIFIFGWTIPLRPRYTSNEIEEWTDMTSFRTKSGRNEVRNSWPKQTFWGSSFWLLNTFELSLVRGDYAIGGCVQELRRLSRAIFLPRFVSLSTKIRQENNISKSLAT